MALRPARREDLPRLEWFGQYAHYREVFRRTFEEQQQGRRLMLLADVGGFPVGRVFIDFRRQAGSLRARRKQGYLYAFRVLEPFRGRGIGTHLLQSAEAILEGRGYQVAVLSVAKDNMRVRCFYERMGYVVYAEDPGRWHYTDHLGRVHHVAEPSWMLYKTLL